MSRGELISEMEQLAKRAYAAGYKETASTLYVLCGALASGNERALMEAANVFASAQIKALGAVNN
jgi:hypothetical protein